MTDKHKSLIGYQSQITTFILEFVTNSGLFWIFDALRVLTTEGVGRYFSLPHLILLLGSFFQTYVLSRTRVQPWWGNFIAVAFYSSLDILLEGSEFFTQAYHIYFWIYSALMALMYALPNKYKTLASLGGAITRTSLLAVTYMLAEWDRLPSDMTIKTYWLDDSGHLFILLSSIMFGILLGISIIARNRLEAILQSMATHLEQITNWIFDPQLVIESYEDKKLLSLKRVDRTILFMDIRGFTAWSEQHDPAEVVQMLNHYYALAEEIVEQHRGFKIQLTGDEIMTRFHQPEDGWRAARMLQTPIQDLLATYQLSAGIGLHTGEVIEGVIGSEKTKQYGIIGDAVNTAARLQSAAKAGEIVVSQQTWKFIQDPSVHASPKAVEAKGKSEPLRTFVIQPND